MTRSRLRSNVVDRDLDLLRFVFEVGVADARQLERLAFPPGHGSALSAARRARRTLARLTDHRLLTRLERRVGGVRAGSSGYLYQVATAGRQVLGVPGRVRFEPADRFIDHALAAAELHVQLVEAQRVGTISDVAIGHEREAMRRFATPSGIERLRPDLLVEVTTADGWELRWFIEIDRGTEHLSTILRKCQTYERYWRSGREADRHDVFPRILWSVPDDKRARAIEAAIAQSRKVTSDLHRIAVAAESAAAITNNNDNDNDNPEGGQP
jgi:hypothetical protein